MLWCVCGTMMLSNISSSSSRLNGSACWTAAIQWLGHMLPAGRLLAVDVLKGPVLLLLLLLLWEQVAGIRLLTRTHTNSTNLPAAGLLKHTHNVWAGRWKHVVAVPTACMRCCCHMGMLLAGPVCTRVEQLLLVLLLCCCWLMRSMAYVVSRLLSCPYLVITKQQCK